MIVELEKSDIINMICGVNPDYSQIKKLEEMGFGEYTGGFANDWRWQWKEAKCWKEHTEEQLYNLYKELTK